MKNKCRKFELMKMIHDSSKNISSTNISVDYNYINLCVIRSNTKSDTWYQSLIHGRYAIHLLNETELR